MYVYLATLLRAEYKFNCGIIGLRKAEKMLTTMLVLIALARQLNIEPVKKMIFYNLRITIREVADDVGISFGSCQAIFMGVLSMKRV